MAESKLSNVKIPIRSPHKDALNKKLGLLTKVKRRMFAARIRVEYIDLLDQLHKQLKAKHYGKLSKGDVIELGLHLIKNIDKLDEKVISRIKDECLRETEK